MVVDFNFEDVDLTEYVVSQARTLTTDFNGSRPGEAHDLTVPCALDVAVTIQGAYNTATRG